MQECFTYLVMEDMEDTALHLYHEQTIWGIQQQKKNNVKSLLVTFP